MNITLNQGLIILIMLISLSLISLFILPKGEKSIPEISPNSFCTPFGENRKQAILIYSCLDSRITSTTPLMYASNDKMNFWLNLGDATQWKWPKSANQDLKKWCDENPPLIIVAPKEAAVGAYSCFTLSTNNNKGT